MRSYDDCFSSCELQKTKERIYEHDEKNHEVNQEHYESNVGLKNILCNVKKNRQDN